MLYIIQECCRNWKLETNNYLSHTLVELMYSSHQIGHMFDQNCF